MECWMGVWWSPGEQLRQEERYCWLHNESPQNLVAYSNRIISLTSQLCGSCLWSFTRLQSVWAVFHPATWTSRMCQALWRAQKSESSFLRRKVGVRAWQRAGVWCMLSGDWRRNSGQTDHLNLPCWCAQLGRHWWMKLFRAMGNVYIFDCQETSCGNSFKLIQIARIKNSIRILVHTVFTQIHLLIFCSICSPSLCMQYIFVLNHLRSCIHSKNWN